jgi:hypothetical protein
VTRGRVTYTVEVTVSLLGLGEGTFVVDRDFAVVDGDFVVVVGTKVKLELELELELVLEGAIADVEGKVLAP